MNASRPVLILLLAAVCALTLAPSAPKSTANIGSVVHGAEMLAPRSGHTATLLPDGRVLIAGGMRRNQEFYRSAELFDPKSGKFQPTGDMLVARVGHAAILLPSGKVLIAGGWTGWRTTDEAELYDPATGRFAAIAHLVTKRGQPEMTLLRDGNVLLTGGAGDDDGSGSSIVAAEIFDSASLKFRPTGAMHQARLSHTATVLYDGRVLIAGGRGSEVSASAELYDPKSGTFRETGHMSAARYKHTAGLLPDGRVLLAGGSDERDWHGTLSSAELYDPQRGTFSAASPMNEARFKLPAVAVKLGRGQLLVAGGNRRAELYDESTGKFAVVPGDMGDPRHFMTETMLSDGRVLLAGGYAYSPEATAQTWIYSP